jgi:cyclopropane fatty-acyl-phospholipid synthase-like methyltransferase
MKKIKITETLTMVDENHLGGFIIENDPATFTPNLWEYLCKTFNIKSVIDIGCGMGYAIKEFLKHTNDVEGIDGSEYVQNNSSFASKIKIIDFTKTNYKPTKNYDLAWSSEFVEHVEEQYIPNYFNIFKNSKYCAITYADIGQDGHYHVNCKPKNYWINLFTEHGFEYNDDITQNLKKEAYKDALNYNPLYKDNHFYNRGLFFQNKKYNIL